MFFQTNLYEKDKAMKFIFILVFFMCGCQHTKNKDKTTDHQDKAEIYNIRHFKKRAEKTKKYCHFIAQQAGYTKTDTVPKKLVAECLLKTNLNDQAGSMRELGILVLLTSILAGVFL